MFIFTIRSNILRQYCKKYGEYISLTAIFGCNKTAVEEKRNQREPELVIAPYVTGCIRLPVPNNQSYHLLYVSV